MKRLFVLVIAITLLAGCAATVVEPRKPSCLALANMAATAYSQPPFDGQQIVPGPQYETRVLSGTLDGEPHAIAQAMIDGQWHYLYWCQRTGSVWADLEAPVGFVEE
jgi:hypothetical protein